MFIIVSKQQGTKNITQMSPAPLHRTKYIIYVGLSPSDLDSFQSSSTYTIVSYSTRIWCEDFVHNFLLLYLNTYFDTDSI